jgi:hypothetical protein
MAIFSGTTMNWLRPVIGFAEQPARIAKIPRSTNDLNWNGMAGGFYGEIGRTDVTECFAPRRPMHSRGASDTLQYTMRKALKEESSFRNPPLWIHVSNAGKWLLSPREAKKRAVIRLLDRLQPPTKKPGF